MKLNTVQKACILFKFSFSSQLQMSEPHRKEGRGAESRGSMLKVQDLHILFFIYNLLLCLIWTGFVYVGISVLSMYHFNSVDSYASLPNITYSLE